MIEEAEIVVHEAHLPDSIRDLPDSHILACKDLTEIDLAFAQADAAAVGDGDSAVVEGIGELREPLIGPSGG